MSSRQEVKVEQMYFTQEIHNLIHNLIHKSTFILLCILPYF